MPVWDRTLLSSFSRFEWRPPVRPRLEISLEEQTKVNRRNQEVPSEDARGHLADGRGEYVEILSAPSKLKWKHPKGEPQGVREAFLHRHNDGSYTHLLRIEAGTEFKPVFHDFFEEAYYVQGEMLNMKSNKTITGGNYVFHEPHEEHGPFKCIKTCLILEFRYFK
jgi:ChrR Cupin-like domain